MEVLLALVGISLAAPGVIDVIVRAGQAVECRASSAKHLERHLLKYRIFGTNFSRGLLYTQLELVSSACRSATIPEELKAQLESCFDGIIECLIQAEKELTAAESNPTKGKIKLLFGRQVGFESKIQELEKQQDTFLSLAGLMHLQQSAPSRSFLGNRFKLRHESKQNRANRLLPTSDILVGQCDAGGGLLKDVIVEQRPYTTQCKSQREEDIKRLTTKLQRTTSIQSIPLCMGYRQNPFEDAYDVIFELPSHPYRRSLADMLASDQTPPLDQRVAFCKLLARAVSDVHSIGLVHKSIRPYAILIVGEYDKLKSSQLLYLTDWSLVRAVDQASFWIGEDTWQRAIYQHPSRQGLHAEHRYTIKHDVYSLGVCMLEILLWQPFVVSSDVNVADSPKAISEHFQRRAVMLGPEQGMPERYFGNTQKMTGAPGVVRRVMVDLCRTELPACAGSKLTDVVMSCLCCLDNEATTNEQGPGVDSDLESGLRYIGDVLVALSSVSI